MIIFISVLNPILGVEFVLLASAVQGCFGSFTSLLTGVLAYIGAVSQPEDRTTRMSILMSMSFVAGTIGPFLGGILVSNVTQLTIFIITASCHLCAMIYTLFFIRNIKSEIDRSKVNSQLSCRNIFSLTHLKESFKTCFLRKSGEQKTKIFMLLVMAFLLMTISAGWYFYDYFL